jgi:hypothetical protein
MFVNRSSNNHNLQDLRLSQFFNAGFCSIIFNNVSFFKIDRIEQLFKILSLKDKRKNIKAVPEIIKCLVNNLVCQERCLVLKLFKLLNFVEV